MAITGSLRAQLERFAAAKETDRVPPQLGLLTVNTFAAAILDLDERLRRIELNEEDGIDL